MSLHAVWWFHKIHTNQHLSLIIQLQGDVPKGSDTMDVQINCHVYFPANGEAKINCTWLSGCVCVGRTFLPLHVIPSRAHRASQCLKGLRVVPLCVSVGWICHSTAHPPLHAVSPCITSPCAFCPLQGCSGSSRQQGGCWRVCSELPEQGWTLCWEQGRATSCTEGSAPSWLLDTCWQTSSSTISRSLLQVCNLRKTNKCSAEWLYLSEI